MSRDLDAKVRDLFAQLGEERLQRLDPTRTPEAIVGSIAEAILPRFSFEEAYDIGFHLADWNSNAAFLVALLLFPERFDAEEIAEGVEGFLIHAPNHVAAAAKLFGYPIEDIFGVDALSGDNEAASSEEDE